MKPTNEVEKILLQIINWLKLNSQLFFTIVGCVVIVGILSFLIVSRRQLGLIRAGEKFSMAQGMYSQGMTEQSISAAREVISQYPKSVAASKSRLLLSEILMSQQKYDEALELAKNVYENGKPKSLRPFALGMLIAIRFEKGDFQAAASDCNLFLEKYPDHFLTPRIYDVLAFLYELQGMLNESKQIYEKIITLYPATSWAERAQSKISKFGARQ